MAFYSIINISKDEYEQDKSSYKTIVEAYKSKITNEEIYLELSLSSHALKENLFLFNGIKDLSIGSVYKEKHLEDLIKLKDLGLFDSKTKNTDVFCPVVNDQFLKLIEDNKYKDFNFIIPVYNSEDLERVYTAKYKKIKIFPFTVTDISSLVKALSVPFPYLKEKNLNHNEDGYLAKSLKELISFINESTDKKLEINFNKLIGNNIVGIIESIITFDNNIELYLAGFAGLSLREIKENIEAIKVLKTVKISIATRNHDYESIKKLL